MNDNGGVVPPGDPAGAPEAAAIRIASAIEGRIQSAYCDGLERALTVVWQERGKHLVLSETFFALTKIWEQVHAEMQEEKYGHRD